MCISRRDDAPKPSEPEDGYATENDEPVITVPEIAAYDSPPRITTQPHYVPQMPKLIPLSPDK